VSSYRDTLDFVSGELVRAGKLNALQFAMGRTRMLGATVQGREYVQDEDPGPDPGTYEDLTLRAGYVRSGRIVVQGQHREDPISESQALVETQVLVLRHSDSATLEDSGRVAAPNDANYQQFSIGVDVPTDEDVRIVVRMHILNDDAPPGRVAGYWRNIQIQAVPSSDGTGPWLLANQGAFVQEPPIETWVHADEGVSTGAPADFNDPATEYPKVQLLVCGHLDKVHLSSHNGGPEYRQRVRQHVDPFLGRYARFNVALRSPTEATMQVTARCGVLNLAEDTVDEFDLIKTSSTTAWVYMSGELDLSALPNNGDMRGVPGFVRITLRAAQTFTNAEMTGVRIYNGIVSDADSHLVDVVAGP